MKKYFLDDGAVKEVLERRYIEKYIADNKATGLDEIAVASKKAMEEIKKSGGKKDDIVKLLYGDISNKIRLTAGEVDLLY